MISGVLTSAQHALLAEERDGLGRLQATLARCEADRSDQDALAQSIRQLDDLFLLVVVGEFNSGKSTFINALVGQAVLEEGVTPTTTQVQLLTYGPADTAPRLDGNLRVIAVPIDILRDIHIVEENREVRFPDAGNFIADMEYAYAAVIPEFVADPAAFQRFVEAVTVESREILQPFREGDDIAFPMHANIATAVR